MAVLHTPSFFTKLRTMLQQLLSNLNYTTRKWLVGTPLQFETKLWCLERVKIGTKLCPNCRYGQVRQYS